MVHFISSLYLILNQYGVNVYSKSGNQLRSIRLDLSQLSQQTKERKNLLSPWNFQVVKKIISLSLFNFIQRKLEKYSEKSNSKTDKSGSLGLFASPSACRALPRIPCSILAVLGTKLIHIVFQRIVWNSFTIHSFSLSLFPYINRCNMNYRRRERTQKHFTKTKQRRRTLLVTVFCFSPFKTTKINTASKYHFAWHIETLLYLQIVYIVCIYLHNRQCLKMY